MAIVSFNATPRAETGKGAARQLRSRGQVPAVIYGHDREAQALSLNARDLDKMLGNSRWTDSQDPDPRDPASPDQAPDSSRRLPGARRRRKGHGQHPDRAHWY